MFENLLRFDNITESLKVGTFVWDTVYKMKKGLDPELSPVGHRYEKKWEMMMPDLLKHTDIGQ